MSKKKSTVFTLADNPEDNIPQPFVIEDSENGEFYSNTHWPDGNKGIGFTTETYTRKEKVKKAIIKHIQDVYAALSAINFDLSRSGELIKDNTKRKSSKK